jgi:hypothetical protein
MFDLAAVGGKYASLAPATSTVTTTDTISSSTAAAAAAARQFVLFS